MPVLWDEVPCYNQYKDGDNQQCQRIYLTVSFTKLSKVEAKNPKDTSFQRFNFRGECDDQITIQWRFCIILSISQNSSYMSGCANKSFQKVSTQEQKDKITSTKTHSLNILS